jgi:putative oxidoreductase
MPAIYQLRRYAMNAAEWDEWARDLGLLFLRVSGGLFLLWVHGLPKLLDYSAQLQQIEDPFHLGANLTLILAIFAEVLCPLLIVAGVLVRLACLPILCVLLVALLIVHPQWSLFEGQFGWLLLIVFTSILIAGPGRLALNDRFAGVFRYA